MYFFYKNLIVLHHDDKIYFSILTSVSNSLFQHYPNDEEIITSRLMCLIKQLFFKKNLGLDMLHNKTIPS